MYENLSKKALVELLKERDENLQLQSHHYEATSCYASLPVIYFKPVFNTPNFKLVSYNCAFQELIGGNSKDIKTITDLPPLFQEDWSSVLSKITNQDGASNQEIIFTYQQKKYTAIFQSGELLISIRFQFTEETNHRELTTNEERYKLIADVTTDFMYEVEMDQNNNAVGVGWLSGGFERITGYTLEEITAFPNGWAQIINTEDSERVTKKVQRDIKRLRSSKYEYRIRTKTGRVKWLEDKVQVREKNGNIRILGAVRDITKEQKTEKALKIERERYSTLFHTSRRGILILDMKARRSIDSNPRMEELFGIDQKAIRAGNTLKFSPKYQPNRQLSSKILAPLFKKHIEENAVINFEWTFLRPDGKEFTADVVFSPIMLENQQRSVMFIDDITDKKQDQTARQLSEERFKLLADSMDDAFCMLDESGLLYSNEAFEKIWEYTADEILINKETFLKTIHGKDTIELSKGLGRLFLKDSNIQYRILTPNKNIKWVWSRTFRINQINGKRLVAVLSSDITKMKNNEAALRKASEDALESTRLKSAFIASMSHEIRTPMNGIVGFTEMLVDPTIPKEDKEQYPVIINKNCQRLLIVLNNILAISKIEAEQVHIRIGVVNINTLLEELHQLFQMRAKQKNIEFKLELNLTESEQYIRTDETRLTQVITNLLSNAIKFTNIGHVILKCYIKEECLLFIVEDTGIGISSHQQNKIFNRFHQAEEVAPSKYGGTGLGLSISEGLTRLLKGSIRVSSIQGSGSSFCLNIPYVPAKIATIEEKAHNKSLNIDLQQRTILVAEDEKFNFMLLDKALSLVNAKVIHAKTGKEALNCLEEHPEIELILMDIRMPELDGMEATRIIKANPKFKQLPIIAQTAFGLNEDRDRLLNIGCDAYIAKPIKRSKLYELLTRFLHPS